MHSRVLNRHSLKTKITATSLLIFVIGIWLLTYVTSRILQDDIERVMGSQQYSTASLIAAQVDQELVSRIDALETVAQGITAAQLANPATLQKELESHPVMNKYFNDGVGCADIHGNVLADFPRVPGRTGANFAERDYVSGPLKLGKVTVGKPVRSKLTGNPSFVIGVPIKDRRGAVIGVMGGIINLGKPNFLDRITKGSYGTSGGYLLVSKQHQLIITASDKSMIMQPLSAAGLNRLIESSNPGHEGADVFVNTLGVEVLSSVKRVPAADWYVVTYLPAKEAFAPMLEMQGRIVFATIALSLLAGGLIWWSLTRQLSPLTTAANMLRTVPIEQVTTLRLPITTQDEIGDLIGGFNSLLAMLIASENRIRKLSLAVEQSPESIVITNLDGDIEYVNEAFVQKTGYSREEVMGKNPRILHSDKTPPETFAALWEALGQGRSWNGEFHNRRKDGSEYIEQAVITPIRQSDGSITHYVAVKEDITAKKAAEEEINTLAFYDPLTRLPNRRLLLDRLKQALASCARSKRYGALLFIDLDNFKTLNDTHGHDIGDLLLQQVAQRLTTCVREGDSVARLGGDEFVVMLEDLNENIRESAAHTRIVGEKIISTLNETYQLSTYQHHSTPSIGITLFSDQPETVDELLKRADMAMYQAKAAGRNTLRFFDPEMQAAVTRRAALEEELHSGILNGQFVLYYQAQVVGTGRVTGVEVLLRWQHPERGIVSPAEFIPLAEETGMILPLGHWVLQTACAQLARWASRPGMSHLTIAVNVSARQFHHKEFVDQIQAILDFTGANPGRLKLELTESLLVSDVESVITKMTALRVKGIRFSLDDFGTGYSSLSYLKRLPLDQLKIDQGFVRDILTDPNDAAIAEMVVVLADSMGLSVIAEGVEMEAQRDFLAHRGCHAYQGYLFSRPLPLEQFEKLAERI